MKSPLRVPILLMLLFLMMVLVVASQPATAQDSVDVYINEIQVSTSSTDWEFIELQGAPGTDLSALSLVGVESDTGGLAGTIDLVVDLSGQTIPGNGFWLGISPTGTATYGLEGQLAIDDNSFENSTATYFLVSGFTAAEGDDLDTDDDGSLDVTPWSSVVDAINLRDSTADFDYGITSVGPDGSFLPSGTYRCPDAPAGTFDSNILNFSVPNGTPGISNRGLCGLIDVYINEIQVSTTSTDWEFVELQGAPGTDLSNLALVQVEADTGTLAGTIDLVLDLSGQAIPGDGYWLAISPAGTAAYGESGDLSIANNSFENSTATYFLVSGFTGAQGDDLDMDNDGTFDTLPWEGIVDAVNLRDNTGDFDYGAFSVGPDGTFLPSGTYRCPNAPFGGFDNNILDFNNPDGSPGVANECAPPPPPLTCEDTFDFTLIHDIQGSGAATPFAGQQVIIEGIVVGDFQENDGDLSDLNGFYVQEEEADVDADPTTSEGIFIFADDMPDVSSGDVVRVVGTAGEFDDQTQISAGFYVTCGTAALPTATDIELPVAERSDLEAYEGMYVRFPQDLVISEYFNFDRFNEIVLGWPTDGTDPAAPNRLFQPTSIFDPGTADAAALADLIARSHITLDDARTASNPDPALHPNGQIFDLDNRFRGGDLVTNATGILGEAFDLYRLQPTEGADYTPVNPRTDVPDPVGGNVEVAAFNVLNYFTTLGSRGADTPEEFERQQAKIVAALTAIDADVFGLIEIENNDEAVANLVAALNAEVGAGTYAYVETGVIGPDEIKQAFIYQPARVSLVGDYAVLDTNQFLDPNSLGEAKNRPALAQTFMDNDTGGIFTAVVNHFKSKGSPCGPGDDDPEAGSCDLTRTLAAQVLADWLATDPTGSGDDDFLIIGDLNSYDKENPIDVLEANGYTDLVFQYQGEYAYSYVFDGQFGYLDYGMANASLLPKVTGTTVWHINADEPDILDYDMSFKEPAQEQLFAVNPYRSSDHDPVIVGLDVCDEIAPTLEVTVTPDTLWPPNHKYVTVTPEITVGDNFDPDPTVTLLSGESNEPDDGLGDGDTPDDIVINDDGTIDLRAERSGTGDGRIYTLTYQATDACGNTTIATATVTVPKGEEE